MEHEIDRIIRELIATVAQLMFGLRKDEMVSQQQIEVVRRLLDNNIQDINSLKN